MDAPLSLLKFSTLLLCCLSLFLSTALLAADTDEAALWQTQHQLRDPSQRQNIIDQNGKEARAIDAQIKSLVGTDEQADRVYGISSDILADLVKQNKGDPAAMNNFLEAAKKDPEGFLNKLSATQREQIRQLASEFSATNPTVSPVR